MASVWCFCSLCFGTEQLFVMLNEKQHWGLTEKDQTKAFFRCMWEYDGSPCQSNCLLPSVPLSAVLLVASRPLSGCSFYHAGNYRELAHFYSDRRWSVGLDRSNLFLPLLARKPLGPFRIADWVCILHVKFLRPSLDGFCCWPSRRSCFMCVSSLCGCL